MRADDRHRGVALVTALLVVAIAASLAAFVAFGQQLWLRQMQNMADRSRADFLERGAIAWAATAFAGDTNNIDYLGEAWARPIPVLPVPGGAIRGAVEDAQARFNLNNVWAGNGPSTEDGDILVRLLVELRLSPDLKDALIDWIDPDAQMTSPGGAEDIDYLQQDPPYRAANQPLVSIDELRLVRGFTPEVIEALRPYVTVLPGHTLVNVNTASPQVVAALVPNLSIAQAEQILADRERTPFNDPNAFNSQLQSLGLTPPPNPGYDVKTGYFLVMLDIVMGRHQRHTEALVARSGGAQANMLVWHRSQALILAADETE
jgi:general secretion pathway protein K